ncbi:response regulator [Streptomyces neyagawaensis]|uniref:response regulator n=2 Tax=Streptomyces neyagawaensis TaxID=42238 RepID=UPI00201D19D0|nr:response regulator transcription factor [Streptomyces neyagawaensis]MCL6731838.1 response regulator transcription factor [Streptomyces neyagawaensis]MDE1683395.1 response regulator transcription factor [Streptomyces neyagawaensis]
MTVRVLLADDDALLRTGVAVILGTAPGIEVVGEAGDGLRAVELCRALAPDVVLMDVRMPGIDGIQATGRIVDAGLATRILVLTTFPDDAYVWRALRAGASGFLLKRTAPERLIDAVRTVAAGDTLLDPSVTRALVERFVLDGDGDGDGDGNSGSDSSSAGGVAGARPGTAAADRARLRHLTAREAQVLRLIAEGLSNAELADRLNIAESTAKTHVRRILHKIGARDRAQAVVLAYRSGLMERGDGQATDLR